MSERRSKNDAVPHAGSEDRQEPHAQDGGAPRPMTEEDVGKLWQQFKSGAVARCPRDNAPLALAVDGATKAYRLVCTRCGNASLWFETGTSGIHVRSVDDGTGPGASED